MKQNKIFGMLVALLALLGAGATVASAATLNEQITLMGFAIGYVFLAIAAIMVIIPLLMKKKTILKAPVFVIFVIIFAVIGAISFADMPDNLVNPQNTGAITPDVTWKVTASATGNTTRINDDANTITVTCDVNFTSGAMYFKGNEGLAFVSPTVTFNCRPDPNSGSVTDLTQGATMEATATDPGKVIYSGGTDYALVTKNSEGTKAYLNWTYDGSTENEDRLVTVQFGATGVVNFTVDWNEAGVSKMAEGDSKTIPLSVAGETWTVQIFVSTVYT
jgi:hypothetical protein